LKPVTHCASNKRPLKIVHKQQLTYCMSHTVRTQNRPTHNVSSQLSCTCSQRMTANDEQRMFKHKYSINLSPYLPLLQRLLHPHVRFDHVQVLLTRLSHVITRDLKWTKCLSKYSLFLSEWRMVYSFHLNWQTR